MSPGVRVALGAAYVGYLACVAYLVWTPAPAEPGGAVVWLADLLPISERVAEFALNVVMLVPLSLLGGLLLTRLTVLRWTGVGLLVTLLIEGMQLVALPTRTATLSDVVANTLGALIGALLLTAGRRTRRRPAVAA